MTPEELAARATLTLGGVACTVCFRRLDENALGASYHVDGRQEFMCEACIREMGRVGRPISPDLLGRGVAVVHRLPHLRGGVW